ncbi:MAG: hypothetical protein HY748_12350 [Elusimicrobia bacterium]|nr:hypothetical protein [Elusimicrobiota bacterium]
MPLPGGSVAKKLIVAIVAASAAGAGWVLTHREPPDITEEQAKAIAEIKLLGFCSAGEIENAILPNFTLKGREPSTDARFRWAFHYLNEHTDPWQKVVVNVGKKGDSALEYIPIPVPEGAAAAAAPASP